MTSRSAVSGGVVFPGILSRGASSTAAAATGSLAPPSRLPSGHGRASFTCAPYGRNPTRDSPRHSRRRTIRHPRLRTIVATTACALLLGGAAGAAADTSPRAPHHDGALARDFAAVDRDTAWTQVDKLKLDFPTYHTEGLAITPNHLFLSAVQIIEPTQKYPTPSTATTARPARASVTCSSWTARDTCRRTSPSARATCTTPAASPTTAPTSGSRWPSTGRTPAPIIYRVDADSLAVHKQFQVDDHIGGIVRDKTNGHLVGNNWGSRRFYEWTAGGRQVRSWTNNSFFTDYQDCQYAASAKMICGGVTNLPQTPSAGGDKGHLRARRRLPDRPAQPRRAARGALPEVVLRRPRDDPQPGQAGRRAATS